MTMTDRNSIERLLIDMQLQGEVVSIHPLPGGISAAMTFVSVKLLDGSINRWVVRQLSSETLSLRPGVVAMEYELLRILKSLGLPVSSPVYLDAHHKIINSQTLVLEYLQGEVDFGPKNQPTREREIAKTLTQIHNVDLQEISQIAIPHLSTSFLGLCRGSSKCPDDQLGETLIRDQLKRHWPPKITNQPVLLHGDLWNGNILWQGKEISGVIDWEDAWIGEPLLDLAGARLDLACIFGMESADAFTCEYLNRRRIDVFSLPVWDLVATLWLIRFINHDLQSWAAFFHSYGRADITAETIRRDITAFYSYALSRLVNMSAD
jgi:aminoglycoside phosphotransferase (APT) family kinase protein